MRAYHGTKHPEEILRSGLDPNRCAFPFCSHVWLTPSPRAAAQYGTVLEVEVEDIDFRCYKHAYHDFIPPERIRVMDPQPEPGDAWMIDEMSREDAQMSGRPDCFHGQGLA